MPKAKRLEKLRIWRPGAVSRAGVGAAAGEIPGVGEARAAEFQVFSFSESGRSDFRIGGLLCARNGHPGHESGRQRTARNGPSDFTS
jgi:hypothetical protein